MAQRKKLLSAIGLGLAGAGLGLYLYGRRMRRINEARFPPLGQFVTVDGLRLHYVAKGEGQAVVFLHGNEGQLQDFTMSLLDRAAEHYRALAFDRPGHGYSERPATGGGSPLAQARLLRQALKSLNVEKPVLVGHSWSGSLVFAYALEYPDEVAGVVLLGGEVYAYDVPLYSRLVLVPLLGDLLVSTLYTAFGRPTVEAGLKRAFAPDPVPAGYPEVFAAFSLRPSQIRAAAEDHLYANRFFSSVSPRYREIAVPVVIMTGDADTIVSPDRAYRLHASMPDSELILLPNSGHELAFTHPEAVLKAIRMVCQRSKR